jgi:hypothetical protein
LADSQNAACLAHALGRTLFLRKPTIGNGNQKIGFDSSGDGVWDVPYTRQHVKMLFKSEVDAAMTAKHPFLGDETQFCVAEDPQGKVDFTTGSWADCGMIDLGGKDGVVWTTEGFGYGFKDPFAFFKYMRPVKAIRSLVEDFLAIANLGTPLLTVHNR